MTRKLIGALALCVAGSMAQAQVIHGDRYYQDIYTGGQLHAKAQDLYRRNARVLPSDRHGHFRVLVTPNLMPRPPAMVAAVAAGKGHCARLGKDHLRLRNVERHADQDISAWAMDFSCR